VRQPRTISGEYGTLRAGVGPLGNGFILAETPPSAILTESELYATQIRSRATRDAGRKTSAEGMLRDLSEVKVGDPVVHEQHGIGRYRGLINMDLGEGETEFLHLEYAGGDTLYVPVSQLHLISRYSGASPEAAPLHKLGSGQWEKAKRKPYSRCATLPPNCSTCMRNGRRAKAMLHPEAERLRGFCRRLRLRRNTRSGQRHPGSDPGHANGRPWID